MNAFANFLYGLGAVPDAEAEESDMDEGYDDEDDDVGDEDRAEEEGLPEEYRIRRREALRRMGGHCGRGQTAGEQEATLAAERAALEARLRALRPPGAGPAAPAASSSSAPPKPKPKKKKKKAGGEAEGGAGGPEGEEGEEGALLGVYAFPLGDSELCMPLERVKKAVPGLAKKGARALVRLNFEDGVVTKSEAEPMPMGLWWYPSWRRYKALALVPSPHREILKTILADLNPNGLVLRSHLRLAGPADTAAAGAPDAVLVLTVSAWVVEEGMLDPARAARAAQAPRRPAGKGRGRPPAASAAGEEDEEAEAGPLASYHFDPRGPAYGECRGGMESAVPLADWLRLRAEATGGAWGGRGPSLDPDSFSFYGPPRPAAEDEAAPPPPPPPPQAAASSSSSSAPAPLAPASSSSSSSSAPPAASSSSAPAPAAAPGAKAGEGADLPSLLEALRPPDDAPEHEQPRGMLSTLLRFQRQALHWMVEKERAGFAAYRAEAAAEEAAHQRALAEAEARRSLASLEPSPEKKGEEAEEAAGPARKRARASGGKPAAGAAAAASSPASGGKASRGKKKKQPEEEEEEEEEEEGESKAGAGARKSAGKTKGRSRPVAASAGGGGGGGGKKAKAGTKKQAKRSREEEDEEAEEEEEKEKEEGADEAAAAGADGERAALHPSYRALRLPGGRLLYQNLALGVFTAQRFGAPPDPRGGVLANEMGLGKTISAAAAAAAAKEEKEERRASRRLVQARERASLVAAGVDPGEAERQAAAERERARPRLGATLVVCPVSIQEQWVQEMQTHAPTLRAVVFEGGFRPLAFVGGGAEEGGAPWAAAAGVEAGGGPATCEAALRAFAAADVVLTTYEVLRGEMRGHTALDPSPLLAAEFWRVVLDEAQTVANASSNAAAMAASVPRVLSWCVSGTPASNRTGDLVGLLRFLEYRPFDSAYIFRTFLLGPFERRRPGARARMAGFLARWMWRHTKAHVAAQIALPPCSHETRELRLSPLEQSAYGLVHKEALKALQALARAGQLEAAPARGARVALSSKVMGHVLALRQAACHPQVVRRAEELLGNRTLTLTEIMGRLVEQGRAAWASALRDAAHASAALAAAELDALVGPSPAAAAAAKSKKKGDEKKGKGKRKGGRQAPQAEEAPPSAEAEAEAAAELEAWRRRPATSDAGVEAAAAVAARLRSEIDARPPPLRGPVLGLPPLSAEQVIGEQRELCGEDEAEAFRWTRAELEATEALCRALHACAADAETTGPAEARLAALRGAPAPPSPVSSQRPAALARSLAASGPPEEVAAHEAAREVVLDPAFKRTTRGESGRQKAAEQQAAAAAAAGGEAGGASTGAAAEAADEDGEEDEDEDEEETKKKKGKGKAAAKRPSPVERAARHAEALRKKAEAAEHELKHLRARFDEAQKVTRAAVARAGAPEGPASAAGPSSAAAAAAPAAGAAGAGAGEEGEEAMNANVCPICFDELLQPVVTECGHSFCKHCIEEALERSRLCPTCRRPLTQAMLHEAAPLDTAPEEPLDLAAAAAASDAQNDYGTKVCALVSELIALRAQDPTAKAVIFSHWNKMLGLVKSALEANGVRYEELAGSARRRAHAIVAFQSDPEVTCFLALMRSGGGMTLTAASAVYILEPAINPGVEAQAALRVHRIGQRRETKVVRLIVRGTVEEKVVDLQRRKVEGGGAQTALTREEADRLQTREVLELFSVDEAALGLAPANAPAPGAAAPGAPAPAGARAPGRRSR
eukprot:tig00000655_g2895.t1